jgi:hypothetical protein
MVFHEGNSCLPCSDPTTHSRANMGKITTYPLRHFHSFFFLATMTTKHSWMDRYNNACYKSNKYPSHDLQSASCIDSCILIYCTEQMNEWIYLPPSGIWRRLCCTSRSWWCIHRCPHRTVWRPLSIYDTNLKFLDFSGAQESIPWNRSWALKV